MWNRTKRLINSYLDELIERASSPDRDVREVTRAEKARLNELEVQTLASAKMFEKELAEVELKMIGVAERERMAREGGDIAAAESAGRNLVALGSQRDLLKQQISEARSSAARARALREERTRLGEDLATETHLTSMRENLAGIQTPFDATDPSSTMEEMRTKINQARASSPDPRLAEAEREYEEQAKRARIDDMLARYKESVSSGETTAAQARQPASSQTEGRPASKPIEEETREEPKTLGRNEGPIRPID
ncbi:MAG TPA: hypothetical protein VJZ26_09005 [Blastocatellia bacterium]|nr:hypothetical protein [Blastocatellia bacterium]